MRKKLLIVEDSDLNRDLLVQVFENDYDLELATDGAEAVDLALNDPPDVVLMDIGLPGMDGLDAVRAIRTRTTDLPIIAVSSHVMPGDRERALAAGCDEFVPKPIDDEFLVGLVEGFVQS
jgi:two-component system cell cycle response regulator DivK